MKIILISLAVVAVIGGVLVLFVLVKFGSAVGKAHGRALYSSAGAWTRIQEFAQVQGKSNYIAEAESKLTLLKNDLKAWREIAPSSTDFAALEKMQATAYETTDRNIKNGQNPLAYLDGSLTGESGGEVSSTPTSLQNETPLGIEVATLPQNSSPEELKKFLGVFKSNQIPHHIVGDRRANHAFVPREFVDAARKVLAQEQQKGMNVTIK